MTDIAAAAGQLSMRLARGCPARRYEPSSPMIQQCRVIVLAHQSA
jgi:hypothetical protein